MRPQATQATAPDRPDSFQLKGGLFPMNLLEVKTLDVSAIAKELERKVQKAPAFFANAPVVLGFEFLPQEDQAKFDLTALINACKRLGLLPAATRGGSEAIQAASATQGLATLAKGKEKHLGAITENPKMPRGAAPEVVNAPQQPTTEASAAPSSAEQAQSATSKPPTKVVTSPIRSGQQIYAPGGDLIVMSAVSAGAEVLADGNIHIYGALRGRALAGVKGDSNARIFCSSQEAELVSIAGHFMVDDQLRSSHWKTPVQIQIKDGTVVLQPLL